MRSYMITRIFRQGDALEIMGEREGGVFPFILHAPSLKADGIKFMKKGYFISVYGMLENEEKNFAGVDTVEKIEVQDIAKGLPLLLYLKDKTQTKEV